MSATKLDEVISTVLRAREDGPDALAAVALSFGSAMELGTLGNTALKARLAETRAALEATEATVTTLRTERDEAREALAAQDSAPDLDHLARAEVWRLRESVAALRADRARAVAERDESQTAHDHTRAQWATVCRERDAAREALATAGKVTAQAVREREAFSLRLSAAERERDEARAERDAALDRVQALHAELVAIRADFRHQRDITEDALRERDEARAALDLARESAREARAEIAQSLALVDEARAALDAALARPTYEARTTMPTPDERGAHLRHGARWLRATPHHVSITHLHRTESVEHLDGATWLPLGADGLPCAWPVPAGEVSP